MKYLLLILLLSSCEPVAAMGKQKQKPNTEVKDKTKTKKTKEEKLNESFEYHKYLWVLLGLAGAVTLAMGMRATGFTLLGIGTAGPVAVFLIESITLLFWKAFVGCFILALIIAIAYASWVLYNKFKQKQKEHDDEIRERERRESKLIQAVEITKGKSKEEGSPLLHALMDQETEDFRDSVDTKRKNLKKRA